MLDLHKNNKIFSIENQAFKLAEDLALITERPWSLLDAIKIIELIYDDYLPTRLEWHCPVGHTAENYIGSIINSIDKESIKSNLWEFFKEIRDNINASLESLFPFKTWGYLFMRVVGTTIIIEDNGDRRIDEWKYFTADGTITPDSVAEAIVAMVNCRLEESSLEQVTWDMESLVRVVYQRALNRRA